MEKESKFTLLPNWLPFKPFSLFPSFPLFFLSFFLSFSPALSWGDVITGPLEPEEKTPGLCDPEEREAPQLPGPVSQRPNPAVTHSIPPPPPNSPPASPIPPNVPRACRHRSDVIAAPHPPDRAGAPGSHRGGCDFRGFGGIIPQTS